jgi:endonuclease/exonuclease/phosphatase family metal-dependent hydrolase
MGCGRKKRFGKRAVAFAAAVAMGGVIVASLYLASTLVGILLVGERHAVPSLSGLFRPVLGAEPPGGNPGGSLKVMTLNLAHGRKDGPNQIFLSRERIASNLRDIAEILKDEKPDIVALQEADGPSLWSGSFDHVRYLAEKAGFPYSMRGEHVKGLKLVYGTAILSRYPLQNPLSVTFAPSPPTFSKGLVVCAFSWPGCATPVDVVSVHLDFSRVSVRKRQAEEMIDALSSRKRPLVLMGDFNCEWTAEEPTLRRIAEKLKLKAYEPEAVGLKTFSLMKSRLDWILISRDFDFETYRVLPDVLSDHSAVVSELRWVRERTADRGRKQKPRFFHRLR